MLTLDDRVDIKRSLVKIIKNDSKFWWSCEQRMLETVLYKCVDFEWGFGISPQIDSL